MALLLSRIILPELASKIYNFALQKHIDEIIEYKCFIVPLIIEKNYNEYKLSNDYVYNIGYLLQDIRNIRQCLENFRYSYIDKYKKYNILFPKNFKFHINNWIDYIKNIDKSINSSELQLITYKNYLYSIENIINNNSNYQMMTISKFYAKKL